MECFFSALRTSALIAASGEDAVSFLHAQLTSDLTELGPGRIQYSGYCTPKGRLLAIFRLWRLNDAILLQVPAALGDGIQARLARHVLRAKVHLRDASAEYVVFGVWGRDAAAAAAALGGDLPERPDGHAREGVHTIAQLEDDRFVLLALGTEAAAVRARLLQLGRETGEVSWEQRDIERGVPEILPATQEQFAPQMVNLDLVGGVSFRKGCYPGQEIVARMHYLGRLKQRMYRLQIDSARPPVPGDPLYSAAFGDDQASGVIVRSVPCNDGFEALAVLQREARAASIHWNSPAGPAVRFLPLPYTVPD